MLRDKAGKGAQTHRHDTHGAGDWFKIPFYIINNR